MRFELTVFNRFVVLSCCVGALTFFAGCGGVSESDVVGKWKMSFSIETDSDEGPRDEIIEQFSKALDRTLEIKEGGDCAVVQGGATQECKWEINEEQLKITYGEGSDSEVYAIVENATKLKPSGDDASYYFEKE